MKNSIAGADAVIGVWYPNRAQWRVIEIFIVTLVIAWVLTPPTEDSTTRLVLGLAIFGIMLLGRHFRP